MVTKEQLLAMCYDEKGGVKAKPECRADMINKLILDEMMDIDEAENLIDKSLREFNLWNEPTLEDLLKDDEETPPQP
jgi:RNA processing factor Prp31